VLRVETIGVKQPVGGQGFKNSTWPSVNLSVVQLISAENRPILVTDILEITGKVIGAGVGVGVGVLFGAGVGVDINVGVGVNEGVGVGVLVGVGVGVAQLKLEPLVWSLQPPVFIAWTHHL
jgi:hypothetical protein